MDKGRDGRYYIDHMNKVTGGGRRQDSFNDAYSFIAAILDTPADDFNEMIRTKPVSHIADWFEGKLNQLNGTTL